MGVARLSAVEFRPLMAGAEMMALVIATRTVTMAQPGMDGRVVMQTLRAVLFALLMGLPAADALAASAREATPAKPVASGSGGATIYFIHSAAIKGFWTPHVVVDNHDIGALPPNTVLVTIRPTGHHTIDVPGTILTGSLHSEIDVVAGQTYYLEFGPYADAPGTQLLVSLMSAGAGARGKLLPGTGPTSFRFYLLDAELARELIAKVKDAGH
jgi:hypothetical protein